MGKDKLAEPLDLNNYSTWAYRFENLCAEHNLNRALLTEPVTDEEVAASERVKTLLVKNVKDCHLPVIKASPNAKMAWDGLAAIFAANNHARRSQLRQEYTKLAMKKGEALPVYLARVRELHTDLLKVGQATSEQDMTYAMLTGLPQKYEVIVSILTTQSGELTLSSATAQLLAFEARVGSMHEASTSSSAFVSAGRGSSATGSAPRRGGSHVRGGSREPLQCWNCGKPGHLERGCTAPRMAQRSGSWSSAPRGPGYGSGGLERTRMGGHGEAAGGPSLGSDRRGYGRHDHVDGAGDRGNASPRNFAFVASGSDRLKGWYLDSGASHHLTYDADQIVDVRELAESEKFEILSVNGGIIRPTAVGTLRLIPGVNMHARVTVEEVYLVPDSFANVLSVAALDKQGGSVCFEDGQVTMHKGGEKILTGQRLGDLYALSCFSIPRSASRLRYTQPFGGVAHGKSASESMDLWHRRYGHLGLGNLERLVGEGMVSGVRFAKEQVKGAGDAGVCEPCVMSRQRRGPFPSTGHKVDQPLALIHLDVCGPMPERTPTGSLYLTVLLDDYTGFSAVAFTPTKEAVKDKVMTMVNQLETYSGFRVKEVRSDQGGEFINSPLQEFFRTKGIRHGPTVGYAPEQNGAAERLNRTLLEKMRALLAESQLPQCMWAEAVSTANYLRNISPVSGRPCTPYEAFSGEHPDVSHLRVFGCTAYVHIPKEKRNKLDPVSRKGVLVGYGDAGQYRILFSDNVVSVHSDVTFDERNVGEKAQQASRAKKSVRWRNPVDSTPDSDSDSDDDDDNDEWEPAPHTQGGGSSTGAGGSGDNSGGPTGGGDASGAGPSGSSSGAGPSVGAAGASNNFESRYPVRDRKRPSEWWRSEDPRSVAGRVHVAAATKVSEPNTYAEAVSGAQASEWKRAMDDEINSQLANGTWTLETPPPGTKLIPCRWVYKVKHNPDGSVERFKARLVAKGFVQREGVDYGELFAPTSRSSSFRVLLAVAAARKMPIHQLDVTTAFLNGELKEDLWMEQPPGYE
ncbi:hypothetical protein VaNZ11_004116 [Volvox africanus]|uniref:Polyprotein n=1 Tax=Volvox africanus TaxID=51714 RepID=A0ABQ5RVP4_9CHLO|nr:hypothetical protein VaNZ11_004116 [Volvox africanus]